MKKYEFIFNDSIKVIFDTNEKIDVNNLHLKYDAHLSKNKSKDVKETCTLCYRVDNAVNIKYNSAKKIMYVNGPLKLFERGTALYVIAEYMAECLQTKYSNTTLIHAAAVYSPQNNTSYLLMGEKGSGKTTICYNICKENGLEIIGNDLVRIGLNRQGELCTYEGSTWLDFRETSIKADKNLNHLNRYFKKNNTEVKYGLWNKKIRIQASELGINSFSGEAKIQKILDVRLDPFQTELYIGEWKGLQRTLLLHEKLGRHISGQTMPFQDDEGNYLGSVPLINFEESNKVREKIINKIIDNNVYQINASSSIKFVNWFKEEET